MGIWAESFQMFSIKMMWLRCNWKLWCFLTKELSILWSIPVLWIYVLRGCLLLFYLLCMYFYFYGWNLAFVQNICCHITTEHRKEESLSLCIGTGGKIPALCSSSTSPYSSKVMHFTAFMKEGFQQSVSLLWMRTSYCSQECWMPPLFSFTSFIILFYLAHFHLVLSLCLIKWVSCKQGGGKAMTQMVANGSFYSISVFWWGLQGKTQRCCNFCERDESVVKANKYAQLKAIKINAWDDFVILFGELWDKNGQKEVGKSSRDPPCFNDKEKWFCFG